MTKTSRSYFPNATFGVVCAHRESFNFEKKKKTGVASMIRGIRMIRKLTLTLTERFPKHGIEPVAVFRFVYMSRLFERLLYLLHGTSNFIVNSKTNLPSCKLNAI